MEHIIKETDTEVIKRFELNKKDIWVVKITANGKTWFGVGDSKKQAETNLVERKEYAQVGLPDFVNEIGSIDKHNNLPKINCLPGFVSFIWSLIPLGWHSKYNFRIISSQDNPNNLYLEIASHNLENEPLRLFSTNPAGPHAQITDCIHQFYIELEKGFQFKKQNKKLGEWQKNWYSKLTAKRLL